MNSRSISEPGRKPAASFLKVLARPDYDRLLRVPPHFSQKYKKCLRGKTVTLQMNGRTWVVYVERKEDGRYEFTRGWGKFVDDVGLKFGEFVICKLVDLSTFDVSVYGAHGCEWEVDCGDESEENETESFVVHLRKDHLYYMTMPKEFAEDTGIINRQWIVLQNEHGRKWRVEVCTRQKDGRIYFGEEGWRVFWEENNLRLGDEIMYTFDEANRDTLVVDNKGNSMASTSCPPKA
ncbi:hypothetical protein CASFOL_026534 [Castilleja foliolosa]|uniref:TF-B3 domain-containing protein n=1 Tax=Castilleja foliolosa TaxID=1961234 RepID=A0ABD3CL21_9LAMI